MYIGGLGKLMGKEILTDNWKNGLYYVDVKVIKDDKGKEVKFKESSTLEKTSVLKTRGKVSEHDKGLDVWHPYTAPSSINDTFKNPTGRSLPYIKEDHIAYELSKGHRICFKSYDP